MGLLRSLRIGIRALLRRDLVDREIHDGLVDYLEREREAQEAAGLALVTVGIAAGLFAARALTTLVESLLFGLRANDAATLGGTAAIMIGVALLAAAVPARRAARVDPLAALRHE